ncbi:hypothetical protein ACN6J9_00095 [Carnobacterium maltaromaticum]|uniref:hypothetical protein n=1 Tax=Carnobacterium maltaromaticum TaxID=2751 RepID=UPI0007052793|nr:hypothetical protein [Carnobacterium maltaromaticum]KRN73900.1 hypothetical protein IV76_GL000019 [Carnobacterium maltaromaticum]MBC9810673.1 hypothetical protein [Carnobacterium maltaromaticum]CRH18380.1 hypothetical protein CM318V1_220019 [Carnobacterium maltaromaticum]CRH22427.1 hypothetical protein BN1423_340020 [Carnobacterium maltaromaticum]
MTIKKLSEDKFSDLLAKWKQTAETTQATYESIISKSNAIDKIIDSCNLDNKTTLYVGHTNAKSNTTEFSYVINGVGQSTNAMLETMMEGYTKLTNKSIETIAMATTNDNLLNENLASRCEELTQAGNILKQYSSTIKGAKSIDANGLTKGLKKIRIDSGFDKIDGVNEGRNKKILENFRKAFYDGATEFTEAEIAEIIKSNYGDLNEKDLKMLQEYYLYAAIKMQKEVSKGIKITDAAEFVSKDGALFIKYIDEDGAIKFWDGSVGVSNPSLSAKLSGNISATAASAGASGSFATITDDSGAKINVGNFSARALLGTSGITASIGASAVRVSKEYSRENDINITSVKLSIEILSASLGASLSSQGFTASASTGLVGLSLTGSFVDKIDINVDM